MLTLKKFRTEPRRLQLPPTTYTYSSVIEVRSIMHGEKTMVRTKLPAPARLPRQMVMKRFSAILRLIMKRAQTIAPINAR